MIQKSKKNLLFNL